MVFLQVIKAHLLWGYLQLPHVRPSHLRRSSQIRSRFSALDVHLVFSNEKLEVDSETFLRKQTFFQKSWERVQNRIGQTFLLLRSETKSIQESFAKVTEVVGNNLQILDDKLPKIKRLPDLLVENIAHLTQIATYSQKLQENISFPVSLYTHVKSFCAAFHSRKVALYSTFSSTFRNYVLVPAWRSISLHL